MELSIRERQYNFFIISSHGCLVFHCLQRAHTHINYLFAANSNSGQAHRARHIIPPPQSCVLLTPGPGLLSPKEMADSLGLISDKLFGDIVTPWRRQTGAWNPGERTQEQVGAGGRPWFTGILHKIGPAEPWSKSAVALGEKRGRNQEESPDKTDQGSLVGSYWPGKTVFMLSGPSVPLGR